MSVKKQLIEALQYEGYEVEGDMVKDSCFPSWAVRISEATDRTGNTCLVLVSGDGYQSKAYGDNWEEALNDIFFMYHCMSSWGK